MDIAAAFKLFDVRGLFPQEVDERLAFIIGKGLSELKSPRKVLVASDTRESSPLLKEFLIDGLALKSNQVFDLYEAPMPQFYYTMTKDDYDLGVMVTASHISDQENGFKFADKNGLPFDEGEILRLKAVVSDLASEQIVVPKTAVKRINTTSEYVEDLIRHVDIKKPKTKLVLDMIRSSVVSPVMVLFGKLQAKFDLATLDHSGNPLLAENRIPIAQKIMETGADLGIMWDSDGDRVIFVDRHGQLISPTFVLGILGAYAIKHGLGKKVVVDVRAGMAVRDLVHEAGGTLEIVPAWAQFIKFAMTKDRQIAFGGENSGHMIFGDFHAIDDGLLAALRFLECWEKDAVEQKLSLLSGRYFELPEKNIPCQPEQSAAILEKLTNVYRDLNYQVSIEDGLTVFASNFKFNLRQSLTEPLLRLNLEATNEQKAKEITADIESRLGLQ